VCVCECALFISHFILYVAFTRVLKYLSIFVFSI